MIAGFGWSAGDIAIAIKVLVKVGKAFHSTEGATARYNEAIQFLQSLKTTLDHVAAYARTNENDFYVDDILTQLEHIRPAWVAFGAFLAPFEASLSPSSSRTSFRRAPRTIEYALKDLGGEIDKLKAAVTQPLQVVNVLLSLQATQRAAARREETSSGSHHSSPQEIHYATPMSQALQDQLDRLQASQDAQLARLATTVERLTVCAMSKTAHGPAHGNESHVSIASLRDSSLGTDISSVFSAADASVYSATDTSSILEQDDCKAPSVPIRPYAGPWLAVHGYRRLSVENRDSFFVPGRVFMMLHRSKETGKSTSYHQSTHGCTSNQQIASIGIQRFLVIDSKHMQSICVPVHLSKRHKTAPENFGPYEVPLCISSHPTPCEGLHTTEAPHLLSLEFEASAAVPNNQLPPHCFVKLRDTCTVSHDEKVLNVGLIAGDDRSLLLALWEDANPGGFAEWT